MNKKSITKSIITMSAIACLSSSLTIVSPNLASAAEVQKNLSTETKNQKSQTAIQDVYTNIDNMLASIPVYPNMDEFKWERTEFLFGNTFSVSGINIKENNITNIEPLFLGSNTFVNNSNLDQTYNTGSFSEAITNTTTTTTQHGFKESTAGKVKVKIPFISETEITQTLEYNFSNTNTNTTSTTKTITAPSQPVKVPANKIYKTEVYFEKKKTSGNVEMYADVLTGAVSNGRFDTVGGRLNYAENTFGLINAPSDPNMVRAKGDGTFTIEYGTNLIVKTYDITSGARSSDSTILVDTKTIPLT
ncbi:ETX/MTX2 family pore-forming toxin [Bacillus cereus]|uniref:ETX/MTX2 family pore-forming toxin n=1 Tax=Bacillus cereus TaxID=1396 RepID=UPI0005CE0044|nr:ETX/MTX2 family pore-forming toxin [Bacillus cereus]